MLIWDQGRWVPDYDPHKGYAKGHLQFELKGHKLKGHWHLVRMRKRPGEKQEPWLLIKSDDEAARSASDPDILEEKPRSVVSRRTIEGIAKAGDAVWESKKSVAENVREIRKAKRSKRSSSARPRESGDPGATNAWMRVQGINSLSRRIDRANVGSSSQSVVASRLDSIS